jgi:hypothetical protein
MEPTVVLGALCMVLNVNFSGDSVLGSTGVPQRGRLKGR